MRSSQRANPKSTAIAADGGREDEKHEMVDRVRDVEEQGRQRRMLDGLAGTVAVADGGGMADRVQNRYFTRPASTLNLRSSGRAHDDHVRTVAFRDPAGGDHRGLESPDRPYSDDWRSARPLNTR
jgi:hypothetical protein